MAGDIFGRQEQVFAGGLSSDASFMFWSGLPNGGLGMLVTQMSIQYQQPIRRIFEIGPWLTTGNGTAGAPVYYIAGRPEGQLQLSRIAGPVAALGGFYRQYGNVCSNKNNLFFVSSSGCTGTAGINNSGPENAVAGLAALNNPAGAFALSRNPYLGWFMNGVVITSIGLSAQAQDMMVSETVQAMFVSLRLFSASASVSQADAQAGVGNAAWVEI